MQTEIITATYPGGEYPIYIGRALINDQQLMTKHIVAKQIMIVTNETIAPLYLEKIRSNFSDYHCDYIIIPDGESFKKFETWRTILDTLANHKHHRDTTVVALGGGVIGDTAGFAAACYHRGVAYMQIPTTLLAQVDASIGGKTAINHAQGKNLIGAFHHPRAVIIDIDTLSTLPEREFRAGISEIIKAALIKDEKLFKQLENVADKLLAREPDVLIHIIKQACIIKKDVVAKDATEQNERALLNFGHTFGHAIEHNLGYEKWLHGEAVAVGMMLAANLSEKKGWLPIDDLNRIYQLISTMQLPTHLPAKIKSEALIDAMQSDKKILDQQLRFILLKKIGEATITREISNEELMDVMRKYQFAANAQAR